MEAMDARRLRLYELLKPKLDEEPARELVLALPAEPDRLVTKDDLEGGLAVLEHRLTDRMDVGFARLESTLTRRMVAIMGAWTVSVASAFAWASVVFG